MLKSSVTIFCVFVALVAAQEEEEKKDMKSVHGGKYFAPDVHIHDQHIKTITITKTVAVPYPAKKQEKDQKKEMAKPAEEAMIMHQQPEKPTEAPKKQPESEKKKPQHPVAMAKSVQKEVPEEKPFHYPVEKLVPYPVHFPVDRPVPYKVEKHVPYPVEKLVPYTVKEPVLVPFKVYVKAPEHNSYRKDVPLHIPVRPEEDSHSYNDRKQEAQDELRGLSYGTENTPGEKTTPTPEEYNDYNWGSL